MTRNVPAVPDQSDKPPAPKRITKKIRAAVDALVHGDAKTITAAAEKVGLSRSHLSRELGRPHISEFLKNKVLRNLAINAARAGAVKVDLLNSPNEMVKDRSSTWLLELAGIKPATSPSVSLNIYDVKAGWVIDLSEGPRPLIDVSPQLAADAAGIVIDVLPNADEREPPIDVTP
jgi:hypothetical protein